jgi:uncharacterized membrane protein YfcA
MLTYESLIIVGVTFLIAGLVKGVIGLGLPTVSLALLTAIFGLNSAMALLLLPSLVTNVWQGMSGGKFLSITRRLWSLLVALCIATWLGVHVLATTDTILLSALLGVLLGIYSAMNLLRPKVPGLGRSEIWLSPMIGGINGLLTGMTGSFVFPGVLYLEALSLPREALIQAMGILFTVSTIALALSLKYQQFLSMELGTLSAGAIIPALIGMVLGQKVRQRLSETVFKKIFFISLLLLGIYLVFRSIF